MLIPKAAYNNDCGYVTRSTNSSNSKGRDKEGKKFQSNFETPVNHHQSNKMASFFAVDMEIMIFFRLIENLSSIFVSSNF